MIQRIGEVWEISGLDSDKNKVDVVCGQKGIVYM